MIRLLLLIIVANSAPVLAADLLGKRCGQSIDAGIRLGDGRPLLGASKTWRGLLAAALATSLLAPLLGLSWKTGLIAGALAMLGDMLASFTKRRLGYASGDRAQLLDAIPEALLPALALRETLSMGWIEVVLAVLLFAAIVRYASPILFRLHIRQRPW